MNLNIQTCTIIPATPPCPVTLAWIVTMIAMERPYRPVRSRGGWNPALNRQCKFESCRERQ